MFWRLRHADRYELLYIMQNEALQLETLNPEVRNYIRELENKYFELKEQYDMLIYKRFCRSAEEIICDDKQ